MFTRGKTQRTNRPSLGGMDYVDPVKKSGVKRKIFFAACLVTLCITMIKLSPSFGSPSPFSRHEAGVTHVLVTGGAGYIGSHAALRLLRDSHRVTIVTNMNCSIFWMVAVGGGWWRQAMDGGCLD